MSCVRPSVKLSTLCSTQEDGESYGAVLGNKSFPRNPGRIPNAGSQLDSFPCGENQRKRGVNEAVRFLCISCAGYSTQTKHQRLRSTFLLWFQSSLQWKFLVFMQPHVNVCCKNHAAPAFASGFLFLALKSQLFSNTDSNVLLIILTKVGSCVKYILYYNRWNQLDSYSFQKYNH